MISNHYLGVTKTAFLLLLVFNSQFSPVAAKMRHLRPLAFTLCNAKTRTRHIHQSCFIKCINRNSNFISQETALSTIIPTRLFGTKVGTPGNPPGAIDIYNEQESISNIDVSKIKETVAIIREILGYPTYDVSIILVEDDEMQETNKETRGIDRPTDILSFQFQDVVEKPGVLADPDFDVPEYYNLGDMIIDVPYVMRRCDEDREFNEGSCNEYSDDSNDAESAEEEEFDNYDYVGDDDRGVSGVMSTLYDPQERIQLLLVHGMLHLVGYDHIQDEDYELMVAQEEEVIQKLQERLNVDWMAHEKCG